MIYFRPEEAERATHNTGKVFQGQTIRVLIRGILLLEL